MHTGAVVPLACEAFVDYHLDAVTLSRQEVEAIRDGRPEPGSSSAGEMDEWREKLRRLGL